VHFLDQSTVEITDEETGDVVVFVGCVLWSNIGEESQRIVQQGMNDYKLITIEENGNTGNLTVLHTVKCFQEQCNFIVDQIKKCKQEQKRVVVVTHNAPLCKGVSDPKYENPTDEITRHMNSAFATDLKHLMGAPIVAWFFGHTHYSSRLHFNNTVIASNQLGYLMMNSDAE